MYASIKKFGLICLLAGCASVPGTGFAADYIFRDLMGNTLPPQKCSVQADAEARATAPDNVKKYAKKFCETQGYGWYVAEQKSDGKLVCDECGDGANAGKVQCHLEDVVVSCKRIKPGSVGLFPGEG